MYGFSETKLLVPGSRPSKRMQNLFVSLVITLVKNLSEFCSSRTATLPIHRHYAQFWSKLIHQAHAEILQPFGGPDPGDQQFCFRKPVHKELLARAPDQ